MVAAIAVHAKAMPKILVNLVNLGYDTTYSDLYAYPREDTVAPGSKLGA